MTLDVPIKIATDCRLSMVETIEEKTNRLAYEG